MKTKATFRKGLDVEKFISSLNLKHGSHSTPDEGMCALEAVAFVSGEKHSDHPKCASKVIGAFLRSWNDSLNDGRRQMLKPYVLRLVGTAADKATERKRAYLAIDWYVRTFAPTWLELANLHEPAQTLRELGEILDLASLKTAQPGLDK